MIDLLNPGRTVKHYYLPFTGRPDREKTLPGQPKSLHLPAGIPGMHVRQKEQRHCDPGKPIVPGKKN